MPRDEVTLRYVIDSQVIAGTVDDVVRHLIDFRDEVGDFGTLLYACRDWVDLASAGARWSSWPER